MRVHRGQRRGVGVEGGADPVRDHQPGVLAGLLDCTDHVPGHALGAQLVGQLGVQHQETAAGQHGDGARGGRRGVVDHRDQLVLALLQHHRAGDDAAVLGHGPVARLGGPDDLLHLLAEPGTGGARVDLELLRDAVVGGRDLVRVHQRDGLEVQLVRDDLLERARERLRPGHGHGHAGERLAHAQAAGLAQRGARGADGARALHGGEQSLVPREQGGVRPVGQVHRATAGEPAPDLLGDERQQRGGHAAHGLEARVEHVERLGVLLEEALAGPAHVPVGERVHVGAQALGGGPDVVLVEEPLGVRDQGAGLGQDVAVHHVLGLVPRLGVVALSPAGGVRVEAEEVVDVPQRQDHLPHAVADSLLGDHQVPAAQDGRGHQEPAHGVRAVPVQDLVDVRVVAQGLGHLLPVRAQHDPVGDHVAERRAVEQRGGQDVQRVEPAAGLADVLHDEVTGVVGLEPLAVLHGVVHLRVGHGPGVEPHVQHLGNAAHHGLTRGVVRVGAGQLVDPRPVQVHLAVGVAGQAPEVRLQLREGAVDVAARVVGIVRLPHGDGRAPVAVAGDGPVPGVLEPLAELTVLDVAGDPVDLLVQLQHAVLDGRDAHEPRGHRAVDQGIPAAPAVRVGVLVGGLAQQRAAGPQVPDHGARHLLVEHVVPGELRERRPGGQGLVREEVVEAPALVHGEHHGDLVLGAHQLVVLAVGRSLVHDARAVRGGHVVRHEDLPGPGGAEALVVREVVPQRGVADARELLARVVRRHGLGHGGGRVLSVPVAEVLGVAARELCRDEEAASGQLPGTGDQHVVDGGAHRERLVGGQGPGRGGPRDGLRARELGGDLRVRGPRGVLGEPERHGHGGVLAHLVDVVVHAQLVVGQRRLVLPAVRQHAVAGVDQALVVQGLERADHGLHVLRVQRLVVVVEVHPAGLAGHVVLPLGGVLHHGGAAGVVERVDAHGLDVLLVGHPELLHGLQLRGQPVGVPAEAALHAAPLLGLVARHEVLDVAGEQVAVVRQAVGEGRAVVEDELVGAVRAAVALVDARLEGVVTLPVVEDALLDRGQTRGRGDALGVGVGARLGVHE